MFVAPVAAEVKVKVLGAVDALEAQAQAAVAHVDLDHAQGDSIVFTHQLRHLAAHVLRRDIQLAQHLVRGVFRSMTHQR